VCACSTLRAHEVVDRDGARLVVRVRVKYERDEERAPRIEERVNRRDRDAGERERQHDADERLQGAAALELGRVLELARNPYRQKIETADKDGDLSNPGVAVPDLIHYNL
jgi:hypothetical protein